MKTIASCLIKSDQTLKGYFQDVLTHKDGSHILKSPWQSNLIVRQCNTLLSMLMKGHEEAKGILYLALGEGETSWDVNRPAPHSLDTQLTNEVYRKPVLVDQIVYHNDNGEPVDYPTCFLSITVEVKGEDVVTNGSQPLREFGLFGGNATDHANSGYMINHVIHERYDLTPELILNRALRLTFVGGVIPREEISGFGAAFPVLNIDGVGPGYSDDFVAEGIQTINDLINIDPLLPIGTIPLIKLREIHTKARLVVTLKATLAPFVQLSHYTISNLLLQHPKRLVSAVESPDFTAEMVVQLQEELALLQVALDNAQLQEILLGDLMNK